MLIHYKMFTISLITNFHHNSYYDIVDYLAYAIYYVPVTYLYFNWKFVTSWSSLRAPVGKESACNAGDPGLIPGLRRSTGEGIGYPLQYSWASGKESAIMWKTWVLSLSWENPLEEGKTTHSSILVWKIPWGHKELDMTEWLSLPPFDPVHLFGQSPNLPSLWPLPVFSIWESVLSGYLFVSSFRFHIQVKSHGICLSLSDISVGIVPFKSIHVENGRFHYFYSSIVLHCFCWVCKKTHTYKKKKKAT